MALALSLGRRGLGRVWPNPAVGCVIVKDGADRRARLDPAGRAAPCRSDGAGAGRASGARGHGLCHAGTLCPSRQDAALRRGADRGGRGAGRGRAAATLIPAWRARACAAARGGDRRSTRRAGRPRRARRIRRVSVARHARAARMLTLKLAMQFRRAHRHRHRRKPVDHRAAGARRWCMRCARAMMR